MKKRLTILLMLLITVGCDDSTQSEQATEQPQAEQPQSVPLGPSDLPIIELPSITNTIGMTLNGIPAGTFMMGSPESEPDRSENEHQHAITISKAFYIQTTEVLAVAGAFVVSGPLPVSCQLLQRRSQALS